jgi:excisionase family DNA binding protein
MSTQTPTPDGTVLLTPAEVARLAQVSRETVYREIDRGELPAVHVGRQLRIDPIDLNQYLGARSVVTGLLQRHAPDRARGSAAAAAKACPGYGFVVDISSPAGRRVAFARSRVGLEAPRERVA